jgi:hypothetical protein
LILGATGAAGAAGSAGAAAGRRAHPVKTIPARHKASNTPTFFTIYTSGFKYINSNIPIYVLLYLKQKIPSIFPVRRSGTRRAWHLTINFRG